MSVKSKDDAYHYDQVIFACKSGHAPEYYYEGIKQIKNIYDDVYLAYLDGTKSLEDVIEALNSSESVEYAEKVPVRKIKSPSVMNKRNFEVLQKPIDAATWEARACQTKEEARETRKEDLKKIYGVTGIGENEEYIIVFIRKESVTDMLPLTICGKPVKAIVTGKVTAGSVQPKEDLGEIENAFHNVKNYKPSQNSIEITLDVTDKAVAASIVENTSEFMTEEDVQNELERFTFNDKDPSEECQCGCHAGSAMHCMPCQCYFGDTYWEQW